MPLTEYSRWIRVKLDDVIIHTTDDVRISSSLDSLNRVCTFTMASQPAITPADGAYILVELIDTKNSIAYDLFGGLVDGGPEVESEPFGMTVRAVDQLSNLRIVRTGTDMNLTGMTPKQAKMAIFDYCNIDYVAGDLVNVNYEFGELEPVKWLADGSTTASSIISEIDSVFGLTTQTIGDNRVISFRYDLMPEDGVGLYRAFTKGSSVDFQSHHRTRGSRSDLQTIWSVTGVTHQFNNDECSMTPWAKSVHGTARVGRSRRLPESNVSSDLIQDESLAAFVVRRHMAETSKIPDTATMSTVTSRNLHPGTKISAYDPTYGITASPRYYCVTQVEISGIYTDLTLVAGPPGDEGSVTTGVDRVCNDTHSDGDLPGDFEPPDFGVPPLDDGITGDYPIPEIDLEEPVDEEPPNTTDPFLDCTETLDEGALDPVPPPILFPPTGIYVNPDVMDGTNYYSPLEVKYHVLPGGASDYVALGVGSLMILNEAQPYSAKEEPGSDVNVSAGPGAVTVTGDLWLFEDGILRIDIVGETEGVTLHHSRIDLAAQPGMLYTYTGAIGTEDDEEFHFGIRCATENSNAEYSPYGRPHNCDRLFKNCNNGGFDGEGGFSTEEWIPFTVTFDFSGEYQRVYYDVAGFSGYMEDHREINLNPGNLCCGGGPQHYDLCAAEIHRLEFSNESLTIPDPDIPNNWSVRLRNVAVGHTTCVANPDYVDLEADEDL